MAYNRTTAFAFAMVAFLVSSAYCQEKVESRQTATITGTLLDVDYVGSSISVKTDSGEITFSVPDEAVITKGADKVGIEDIENTDTVAVEYYSPSPGQNVAVSIVDTNLADE